MKMSRTITLKLLTGLTLTGCLTASGCGGAQDDTHEQAAADANEPVDETWYDESGNAVQPQWKVDEQGNRVLDAEGRPVPEPGIPRDRHGHLWVYHHGVWVPPIVVFGPAYRTGPVYHGGTVYHSAPARSSSWVSGGSGYRTPSTTTPYRAPSGTGSHPVHTAPSAPSSVAGAKPPSGSSITRGGFGSTGSASASSASS
ncbi:hypothetical protein GobsT_57320 [Gemmata obscuriglobus]|uniref:Lipoprotein n=1 Tax=Gemmata obscuriglobus TaxID=114 RepID=A0A2Z3GRR4_9BACT|nr:hypothetical protein [Gemmata obscuriglobus]AWM36463.1 hypothetical protein C1280_05125 [Gemmata obscuriglobus]QEG30914.1 hypothetical protein GobsT_57320 [Gemmata obscuriglobus]VTS10247.1 unnamed protein product [Gemmata obscuriglobus UQM 2246]